MSSFSPSSGLTSSTSSSTTTWASPSITSSSGSTWTSSTSSLTARSTATSSSPSTPTSTTSTATAWRQRLIAGVAGEVVAFVNRSSELQYATRMRIRPASDLCGTAQSSSMDAAVQPAILRTGVVPVPLGAPNVIKGEIVEWSFVRIVRPERFRICTCVPPPGCLLTSQDNSTTLSPSCCISDAEFSDEGTEIEVAGPGWTQDLMMTGHPVELEPAGIEDHPDSNLRLWRVEAPGFVCGSSRSAAEQGQSNVQEIADFFNEGSQRYRLRAFRRGTYYLCWCPGIQSLHGTCSYDSTFVAEVGMFHVYGPETENIDTISAVVGAPFSVTITGDLLSVADRLRIFDAEVDCGAENVFVSAAVARYVCRRGADCVASPAMGGAPNEVRSMTSTGSSQGWRPDFAPVRQQQQEMFEPVMITTPGSYRLCWCVDVGWNPETLESFGHCLDSWQYSVPVGDIVVQGVNSSQYYSCQAFSSCLIRMYSPLATVAGDGLLLVALRGGMTRQCGRGAAGYTALAEAIGWLKQDNTTLHYAEFRVSPDSGPPGSYKACYCSQSAMGTCNISEAFAQHAGTFEVRLDQPDWLPDPVRPVYKPEHQQICNVGVSCGIWVQGMWAVQLSSSDVFRAVAADVECSDPDSGRDAQTANFFLSSQVVVDGLYKAKFLRSTGLAYGDYKLCYCRLSGVIGSGCSLPDDSPEDAGSLHIVGRTAQRSWSCAQGAACSVAVPVWRADERAVLLVVSHTTVCREGSLASAAPADGFAENPSYYPVVEGNSAEAELTFDLGNVHAAGSFRACLCIFNASPSSCTLYAEFLQEAGTLRVQGPLSALDVVPSDPPTAIIISLRVVVERSTVVRCALATDALAVAPSSNDVMRCFDRIDGCVGLAASSGSLSIGAHVMHIPLQWASANQTASVRAWCIADVSECPSQRCAIPATGEGLPITLVAGVNLGQYWSGPVSQLLNIVVRGNPLNSNGGDGLELRPISDTARCDQTSAALEVISLTRPLQVDTGKSATWQATVATPGTYRACWCDRSVGGDCILWHDIGTLHVNGPTAPAVTVAGHAAVGQELTITVPGVNLSAGYLAWSFGNDCSNRSSASPITPEGGMVFEDSQTSMWNFTAPTVEGNFTLCWGQSGVASSAVAHVSTILHRSCVVSGWEAPAGPAAECSQSCGGGLQLLQRRILVQPSGDGQPCPPAEDLQMYAPCNTAPCPLAVATRSWTKPAVPRPGEEFQVVIVGEYFNPAEDAVLVIPASQACGSIAAHDPEASALAACDSVNSTGTELFCGDDGALMVSLRGEYRICLCDATWAPRNESFEVAELPCSGLQAFDLEPLEGSLFDVSLTTRLTTATTTTSTSWRGAFTTQGGKPPGISDPLEESAAERTSFESGIIAAVVCGAIIFLAIILCVWWRGFRGWQRLQSIAIFQQKVEADKESAQTSIIRQTTQRIWDAFALTMHEAAEEAEAATAVPSEALGDEHGTASRPGTSETKEEVMPPTPPTGRNSTPESNNTGATAVSHRSFIKMQLPQQGPVGPPTPVASCFLDMPLLGKPSGAAAQDTQHAGAGVAAGLLGRLPTLPPPVPLTREGLIKGVPDLPPAPPAALPGPPPVAPKAGEGLPGFGSLQHSAAGTGTSATLAAAAQQLRAIEKARGPATPPMPMWPPSSQGDFPEPPLPGTSEASPGEVFGSATPREISTGDAAAATRGSTPNLHQVVRSDSDSSQSVIEVPVRRSSSKGASSTPLSSMLQRIRRPFSAGRSSAQASGSRPGSAGLVSRGLSIFSASPKNSTTMVAELGGVSDEEGQEPPRRCPDCGKPLVWSDGSDEGYDHGWDCNFIEKCGRFGAAGEWRWFCGDCKNDFCNECYTQFLPPSSPAAPWRHIDAGEAFDELEAPEPHKAPSLPVTVIEDTLPTPPPTQTLASDEPEPPESLPVPLEVQVSQPFPDPEPTRNAAEDEGAAVLHEESAHREGLEIQSADPSLREEAAEAGTEEAEAEGKEEEPHPSQAEEDADAQFEQSMTTSTAGPAAKLALERIDEEEPAAAPDESQVARASPNARARSKESPVGSSTQDGSFRASIAQSEGDEDLREEMVHAQARLQADWYSRLRADAWQRQSLEQPQEAKSSSLRKAAAASRTPATSAAPSQLASLAPSQLASPRDSEAAPQEDSPANGAAVTTGMQSQVEQHPQSPSPKAKAMAASGPGPPLQTLAPGMMMPGPPLPAMPKDSSSRVPRSTSSLSASSRPGLGGRAGPGPPLAGPGPPLPGAGSPGPSLQGPGPPLPGPPGGQARRGPGPGAAPLAPGPPIPQNRGNAKAPGQRVPSWAFAPP